MTRMIALLAGLAAASTALAQTASPDAALTVEQMEAALGLTEKQPADDGQIDAPRFRAPSFGFAEQSTAEEGGGATSPAARSPGAFAMPIEFDLNSAGLTSASRDGVRRVAELLARHPRLRLTIRGHTDGTGSAEANEDLSRRRAGAVRAMLVRNGVSQSRLSAEGWGERQPLDGSDPDDARNRRVEFINAG